MTPDERDTLIQKHFGEDMKLLRAKGHDYAGEQDALANLREFGTLGIIVRLSDKFSRMKQFAKSGRLAVAEESLLDIFRDIRIYCYLAQVLLEEETYGCPVKAITDED